MWDMRAGGVGAVCEMKYRGVQYPLFLEWSEGDWIHAAFQSGEWFSFFLSGQDRFVFCLLLLLLSFPFSPLYFYFYSSPPSPSPFSPFSLLSRRSKLSAMSPLSAAAMSSHPEPLCASNTFIFVFLKSLLF